ncbi:MAG: STAS domain-containing protein [bacterium]|nr:STAS domain-containing protein [bacterium]
MRHQGTIPILKIGEFLLASIQFELHDIAVDVFQEEVLLSIEKTSAKGLVIDISALDSVDSYVAGRLTSTGRMAKLMGTETVLVGMRPEIAATLVRMGFPMRDVHTALSLEEGIELLNQLRSGKNGRPR